MFKIRSKQTPTTGGQFGMLAGPNPAVISWAAMITAVVALMVSLSSSAGASQHGVHRKTAAKGSTVAAAASCPQNTVDLGTWCMMKAPYPVPATETGDNNYFWATQACVKLGGYLPDAGQLIGAANRVPLESVITDNPTLATIETDPTTGLQDQNEMSSTLVTTAAGSDAAGSEGVSVGSTGNPNEDQPDPTPAPADPAPATLQYVTVFDNHQKGGFAGSVPVSDPDNFRCAFWKIPGGDKRVIP